MFAYNGGTYILVMVEVQNSHLQWRYRSFFFDGGTNLLLMMEVQIFHFWWRYRTFAYDGGTYLFFVMQVRIFCLQWWYRYFVFKWGYRSFVFDGGTDVFFSMEVQIFCLQCKTIRRKTRNQKGNIWWSARASDHNGRQVGRELLKFIKSEHKIWPGFTSPWRSQRENWSWRAKKHYQIQQVSCYNYGTK